MAYHISKEGVWPSKENLKAVARCAPPQTYTKIWAFLGLVGYYQWIIKGFMHIAQPQHEYLSGAGTSNKNKHVTLTEHVLGAFTALKKGCLETPVLTFADFNKLFLLETDASKLGLGAVLSQKQTDGQYHLVAYTNHSLTAHECNCHLIKQEFLALKGHHRAVSWIPALEAICFQDWQQLTHLYPDQTQFRCYPTPLGRTTCRIHL